MYSLEVPSAVGRRPAGRLIQPPATRFKKEGRLFVSCHRPSIIYIMLPTATKSTKYHCTMSLLQQAE
eukprot:scaffold24123_cov215-Skeletonema_dohrnii-CCMP3373.AAC.3